MAELMAWADAPSRALGRFEVRTPPRTIDEMFAEASNEKERQAIQDMLFGSAMDVLDRFFPDPEKHRMIRAMMSFLAVNSTYKGPVDAGERHLPRVRARPRPPTPASSRSSMAASARWAGTCRASSSPTAASCG